MATIETKEQIERVRVSLAKLNEARRGVEKAHTFLRDAASKLGNSIGSSAVDPQKLEEEARRMIADAIIAGVHEQN